MEKNIIEKLEEMQIELIDIEKLKPDPMNTKKHPQEQIDEISNSMKKRWTNPILVDDSLLIIAGHGRLLAGKQVGFKKVPCIILKGLTEAEKIEFQIFDNRSAEKSEWDFEKLQSQIDKLMELGGNIEFTGWNIKELEEAINLDNDIEDNKYNQEEIEKVPEVNEINIKSKVGDLFFLGNHRLLCGDCTIEKNIELLTDKVKVDMVFTDPPYNVNFKSTKGGVGIINDNIVDRAFDNLLKNSFKNIKKVVKEGAHIYVCCNYKCYSTFEKHFLHTFKTLNNCIVWKKDTIGLGTAYRNKHEFILFGGDFESCIFDSKNESNVWEFPSAASFSFKNSDNNGNPTLPHPTMKPVAMVSKAIKNSSLKYNVVLDIFGGSGSTLIACEQTNRVCYIMELDPKYCDLIIKRWQDITQNKAKRSDGKLFDQLEEYTIGE